MKSVSYFAFFKPPLLYSELHFDFFAKLEKKVKQFRYVKYNKYFNEMDRLNLDLIWHAFLVLYGHVVILKCPLYLKADIDDQKWNFCYSDGNEYKAP